MSAANPRPPNIIYLYADDLGRGMLSCHGQKWFQTPNIDRVAHEGMRFERAYGCAFCAPSRASLLTGQHDCHRGGWTFTPGGAWDAFTSGRMSAAELSELIMTTSAPQPERGAYLAELARQAGYTTAQIGKLEWGFATCDAEIRAHGWDMHYGYYDHQQCHGFYPPYLFDNGKRVDIKGNTRADFGKTQNHDSEEARARRWDRTGKAVYSQDIFDEKILEFLRSHQNKPFFLYHPSQLPHGPIAVTEIDPAVAHVEGLTGFEKEYASMVLRLDRTVGIILDELERLGIADHTMVIFASDNGHESGYYQQEGRTSARADITTGQSFDDVIHKYTSAAAGDVFDGNDGMAGKKRSSLEGGVRLPFMVRWPEAVAPGSRSERLVAGYDFVPLFAELFGQRLPETDGLSFLAELRGRGEEAPGHEHVVFASGLGPALTTNDGWKLRFIRGQGGNAYQLYHLPDDYAEERDLVDEHPEIVERLSTTLLRACDGNHLHGTPQHHQVFLPGLHFFGQECHWGLRADYLQDGGTTGEA